MDENCEAARLKKMRFRHSVFDVDVIEIPGITASSMYQPLFSSTDKSYKAFCNSQKQREDSFDPYNNVPHPEAE